MWHRSSSNTQFILSLIHKVRGTPSKLVIIWNPGVYLIMIILLWHNHICVINAGEAIHWPAHFDRIGLVAAQFNQLIRFYLLAMLSESTYYIFFLLLHLCFQQNHVLTHLSLFLYRVHFHYVCLLCCGYLSIGYALLLCYQCWLVLLVAMRWKSEFD